MLLTAATSSLLAIAGPGVAVAAHQGKRHHRAHHQRAHHARVIVFGAATSSGSGATGMTTPTTPATTPTTPTTPGTSGETAGTVTSFTAGVLTITLTDGTPVSGKVTEGTEIQCQAATPAGASGDDQGEDESGADDTQSPAGQAQARMSSHDGGQGGEDGQQSGEDGQQSGEDGQHGGEGQQSCTTAALVPGAVVREAELSVSSAGAVWHQVDLMQ